MFFFHVDYAPYIFEKVDKKKKGRRAAPVRRTWKRTTPIGNPNATTNIGSILGVDPGVPATSSSTVCYHTCLNIAVSCSGEIQFTIPGVKDMQFSP